MLSAALPLHPSLLIQEPGLQDKAMFEGESRVEVLVWPQLWEKSEVGQ